MVLRRARGTNVRMRTQCRSPPFRARLRFDGVWIGYRSAREVRERRTMFSDDAMTAMAIYTGVPAAILAIPGAPAPPPPGAIGRRQKQQSPGYRRNGFADCDTCHA